MIAHCSMLCRIQYGTMIPHSSHHTRTTLERICFHCAAASVSEQPPRRRQRALQAAMRSERELSLSQAERSIWRTPPKGGDRVAFSWLSGTRQHLHGRQASPAHLLNNSNTPDPESQDESVNNMLPAPMLGSNIAIVVSFRRATSTRKEQCRMCQASRTANVSAFFWVHIYADCVRLATIVVDPRLRWQQGHQCMVLLRLAVISGRQSSMDAKIPANHASLSDYNTTNIFKHHCEFQSYSLQCVAKAQI